MSASITETFTLSEELQLQKEARNAYEGKPSDPIIRTGSTVAQIAISLILKQAQALQWLIDLYKSYIGTLTQNNLRDTFNLYDDIYIAMTQHDYDLVQIKYNYSTKTIPPSGDFEGGSILVQSGIPELYAFHTKNGGWIIIG